jgi:ketosteroid isomerase-like protein
LKGQALLRRAYEAFNARDIDGALALMHPDVQRGGETPSLPPTRGPGMPRKR